MRSFIRTLILFLLSSVLAACFHSGDGTSTYTIGGSVTGLEGTGLVLQNNSGDDLAISTNGSFTFVTALKNESVYNITVLIQPSSPNQTCTVTNGSGTLSGSKINNVSVTCITNSYTIGGSITGLSGTGLVLQNNGTDNLPITSNDSFIFATAIVDGSGYIVTVLTQPTGQFCTLNNSAGTLGGIDITNVTVTCVNTYTIGGTVSGLTDTLVLQSNGTDDLGITADEIFTFATAIADGSSYNVTVLIQPTGQTCTISNAGGTVTGADVMNVTLSCSKVSPLYSTNGFDWNDYVQGNTITNATDTACDAVTDSACLHGGEIRVVELTGEVSCTGITASDTLGAFDWICDDSTGAIRVMSSGLASGYGLANLVDFATPGWNENSLTVYKDTAEIETTTPAVWWSNPVVANTSGGVLDVAGTVYLVSGNTVAAYDIIANNVSLVAAPGVVITGLAGGDSSYVISATGMDFLWLEGMALNAAGDNAGVYWNTVRFSAMRDLTAGYADKGSSYGHGIWLSSSSNNTLSGVTASNNATFGVYLYDSSENTLLDVTANNNGSGTLLSSSSNNSLFNITGSNNTYQGVEFRYSLNNVLSAVNTSNNGARGILLDYDSNNNTLSNVTASNNEAFGVALFTSGNTLFNVTASNNDSIGFYVAFTSDNMLSNITASNNSHQGVYINSTTDNTFSRVTVSNNQSYGVYFEHATNNMLSGVTASNNQSGVVLARSSYNTLSGLAASNNNTGVELYDASENYFTGDFQVGTNWTDCNITSTTTITNPGLDDDSDPSDQGNDTVHDGLCIQEGASDFGTAVSGITLASSFVGKVAQDDAINISDTAGSATITDFALSFDWENFENPYRAWGVDGSAFPDLTNRGMLGCSIWDINYINQTDCEANSGTWTGDARIWDWSLLATDTVIKDALLLPTGNDTLTHTWSDTSTITLLRSSVEILGDGIGNDNLLCETNETCLFTPNMGSYQGHGNLINAGSIGTGGTLENITLKRYETNGY